MNTDYLPVLNAYANVSAKPPVPYKNHTLRNHFQLEIMIKYQFFPKSFLDGFTLRTTTGLLASRERLTMLSDCSGSPPTSSNKEGMGSGQPY